MPRKMPSGRARISATRPRALGVCDRCGIWWNLDDLSKQAQWAGNSLRDTGLLVCRECLDVPQEQYRNPILPADPIPRYYPRPEPWSTPTSGPLGTTLPVSPENLGFTVYTLGPAMVRLFILGQSILGGGDVLGP